MNTDIIRIVHRSKPTNGMYLTLLDMSQKASECGYEDLSKTYKDEAEKIKEKINVTKVINSDFRNSDSLRFLQKHPNG